VRYSAKLEELEITFERRSFENLLRISKVPAFRDRIYTICLHLEVEDDESYDSVGFSDEHDDQLWRGLPRPWVHTFLESEWAAEVLAGCFRNLQSARNLERIRLRDNFGHDLVLRAMSLAGFCQRLVCPSITPEHGFRWGYGCLLKTPEAFKPYMKGLKVQSLLPDPGSIKLSAKRREENSLGLHVKNYLPTTAKFAKLMSAFIDVEEIELNGCRSSPRLRICHGCDDLFVNNFAPVLYHNLRSFTIEGTFISGGRLRRFIKRHAETLISIQVRYVSLTDGSWRSIAQGLAKLPHLNDMKLVDLWQKHAAKTAKRSADYPRTYAVEMKDQANTQHFLRTLVEGFSTVQYLNPRRMRRSPPIYHQVKLFELPGVSAAIHQSNSILAMRRYAEVDGPD
jgi:hypothetical protein